MYLSCSPFSTAVANALAPSSVWAFIKEGFLEKPFALVGFAAFLLMLPMDITSTKGWQRRLGKTWKAIHRWIYAAGILAVVHYLWVVKSDIREPLVWGVVVAGLLLLRFRKIKWGLRNALQTWVKKVRNPARGENEDLSPKFGK